MLVGHGWHVEYPDRRSLEWANFLHVPAFAVLFLVIRSMITTTWRSIAAFGLCGVIGTIGELVQLFGSRNADPMDVVRDMVGAGVAWTTLSAISNKGMRRIGLVCIALALVGAVAASPLYWSWVFQQRAAQLPFLARFEQTWELELWETHHSKFSLVPLPSSYPDRRVARLEFEPEEFPGASFEEIYPDWSGYDQIVVDVFNPGVPVSLSLRVHDVSHDEAFSDRFNLTWDVPYGGSELRIELEDIRTAPDGREMDLTRIEGLVLFAHELPAPVALYFANLRLETVSPVERNHPGE